MLVEFVKIACCSLTHLQVPRCELTPVQTALAGSNPTGMKQRAFQEPSGNLPVQSCFENGRAGLSDEENISHV